MREYEFRGKDLDTGNWVYGDLHTLCDKPHIHTEHTHYPFAGKRVFVDPETVGQYTGWSRRGKYKLYEGDIIGFDDWAFSERQRKKMRHHIGVIEWHNDDGKFVINCGNDGIYEGKDVADPQLLGNIYDNPNLLKV